MSGRKPEAFTDAENRAMRFALRKMQDHHKWSQAEVGRRLGIGQQAAGVILRKNGGFSRPTALALAQLSGFDGPETLLKELGALADVKDAPQALGNRDIAAGIARRNGCDERAIERVIARYTEGHYVKRPVMWWLTRFGLEDAELAAERRTEVPPSTRDVTRPAVQPKRRRSGT